jgi:HAMP domain-containing protein
MSCVSASGLLTGAVVGRLLWLWKERRLARRHSSYRYDAAEQHFKAARAFGEAAAPRR